MEKGPSQGRNIVRNERSIPEEGPSSNSSSNVRGPANPLAGLPHQHQQQQQQQSLESSSNGASNNQNNGGGGGAAGGDSPDSGSLYSDEIPSGYNSGEQYDTLSTGYMSGEAYELPETRMDLHEPSLDVIDECLSVNGDAAAAAVGMGPAPSHRDDDDGQSSDIFSPPQAAPNATDLVPPDNISQLSGSSSTDDNNDAGTFRNVPLMVGPAGGGEAVSAAVHASPTYGGGAAISAGGGLGAPPSKGKHRKKVTTFAVPIEHTPLHHERASAAAGSAANTAVAAAATLMVEREGAYDVESSDAGGGAATGGYRAVPSDTDTSAFDSDAAAIHGANTSDSGTDLLYASRYGKAARLAARKIKKMRRDDLAWFEAHDNKYWSWTRVVCFWGAMLMMLLSVVAAGVLIFLMPRTCDPTLEWYQGRVTMEVRPEVRASNGEYIMSLEKEMKRLPTLRSIGVTTVHLKDITLRDPHALPTFSHGDERRMALFHPTADFEAVYADTMNRSRVDEYIDAVHRSNMTFMIHVPVVGKANETERGALSLDLEQAVARAIRFWAAHGADGIFLDGLEHFGADRWVGTYLSSWDSVFRKYGTTDKRRILMASYRFIRGLTASENEAAAEAMEHIGLLDAHLDLDASNVTALSRQIEQISAWDATEGRPWINWNLQTSPTTKAALAFQLLLPGTITVRDEFDAGNVTAESKTVVEEGTLKNLTRIRTVAVPILMNGNYRRCECDEGHTKESNFVVTKPVAGKPSSYRIIEMNEE